MQADVPPVHRRDRLAVWVPCPAESSSLRMVLFPRDWGVACVLVLEPTLAEEGVMGDLETAGFAA